MANIRTIIAASLISCAASAGFASQAAAADAYPSKPIRFIVPIAAGGSTDVLARDVAQKLQERLGQPVVVENRPGGAGSIGTAAVANAPPDGYTILLVNSSHSINPHVYKSLSYDAIKDFTPISLMSDAPMGIYVHPSVDAHNVKELIALAKSKPGGLSFASSGNGGAGHLTAELFMQEAGIKMMHVPYRGSALAINDVLAGQVPVLVGDVPLTAPHVKSGALRAIGVATAERSALLPDVPTFAESGLPGAVVSIWVGVLAPAGVPSEISHKLSSEIAAILHQPEMEKKIGDRGFRIMGSTPEEFAKIIRQDYEKYGVVAQKAGIKAE